MIAILSVLGEPQLQNMNVEGLQGVLVYGDGQLTEDYYGKLLRLVRLLRFGKTAAMRS